MSTAEATVTEKPEIDLKGLAVEVKLTRNPETDEAHEQVDLVPSSGQDVIVFAQTPEQMSKAQDVIIAWGKRKLAQAQAELVIREDNLQAARDAKIRTQAWSREVKKYREEVTYREKILEALVAGYYIVPDFPLNIIGVRTYRTEPWDQNDYNYQSGPDAEEHQQLPVGEGEYKDAQVPVHKVKRQNFNSKTNEMEESTKWTAEGSNLRDIDFPFRLIRPHLLNTLKKVMEEKIFDAIGVLPNQRKARDPMLIGVIENRISKYNVRRMLFLISWWLPTEDL